MPSKILRLSAIALLLSFASHAALAESVQEVNKKIVADAMRMLLVERKPEQAMQRYFGSPYLQHNPTVPGGVEGLPRKIKLLPAEFKYEPGVILAEGDLVMMHGRYTGWEPTPMVAVDIFRVKNGKLVEHWDVMQEDVPAAQTRSGRPMFPIAD